MKKEISELTVLYNDKTVGYLKQEDDTIAFQEILGRFLGCL